MSFPALRARVAGAVLCLVLLCLTLACDSGAATPTPVPATPIPATTQPAPTDTTVPPSATAEPPTETALPPTETEVPPTETAIPPTETEVPPTATAIPPTRVRPTQTAIPPTRVPPTRTAIPPPETEVPPTDVPPSETEVPPTETAIAPTETAIAPTETAVPLTETAISPTETETPPADVSPTETPLLPTATGLTPTETVYPTETHTPSPTAAPPTATARPATTGLPSGMSQVVRVPPGKKRIALTFDAGAGRGYVPDILDALAPYDAHVTFFITGQWAAANPDQVRAILSAGHEIANHSFTHPDFTKLTDAQMIAELARCEAAAVSAGGRSTKPYWRPPYGAYNAHVLAVAAAQGYRSIYWTWDSLDSVGKPKTKDFIVKRVAEAPIELDGAIILQHVAAEPSIRALPEILARLTARGLRVVPVSELLAP